MILKHWHRDSHSQDDLLNLSKSSDIILFAISDSAIEEFVISNLNSFNNKVGIHFSGSLYLKNSNYANDFKIYGAHPLMTFSHKLYDKANYKNIPFICDFENTVQNFFPLLENKEYYLSSDKKALYHGLCVSAGNFTQILWTVVQEEFRNKLNLPSEVLNPYKKQIFLNLLNEQTKVLTGPFVRNDHKTIGSNKNALKEIQLDNLYQDFFDLYNNKNKDLFI